jgi:hypothetical protein
MGGTGIVPLGPDGQPLPQGEGGGNIEDELLRRFQMQQGMYF